MFDKDMKIEGYDVALWAAIEHEVQADHRAQMGGHGLEQRDAGQRVPDQLEIVPHEEVRHVGHVDPQADPGGDQGHGGDHDP